MSKTSIPAIENGFPVRSTPLPFAKAWIGEEEIQSVTETLRSGWLTTGPKTKLFEKKLAEYLHARRVVCLNSCTSALHLAVVLCNIGPGDQIITTPITFPSTANVILHSGAEVIFADIDPETLNIDPDKVAERITPRTKAIIPVHMAGQPCDLDALKKIADQHNLMMIQDCAHALESKWNDHYLMDYGHLCTYSFYAIKNLTCGEGGAIAGNDELLMEKADLLSLFGISKDAWKRYSLPGYQHWETIVPGYKYNMSDIQASIGLEQFKKLNEIQNRRQKIAQKYDEAFSGNDCLIPVITREAAYHARQLYILRLRLEKLKISRDKFMKALEAENIGIGIHFRSLLQQEYYKNRYPDQVSLCPHATEASNRILSIPLYPGMTENDVNDVIKGVLKLLRYYSK